MFDRLVTGGQTGVDRGALDAAIAFGLPYGGWCPKGGWAEDMAVPPGVLVRYPNLRETPARDPAQRTRRNVRDSDGVLFLFDGRGLDVSPGTRLAETIAERHGKPRCRLCLDDPSRVDAARAWLEDQPAIRVLNVAGPRESEAPGIYCASRDFVAALLSRSARGSAAQM